MPRLTALIHTHNDGLRLGRCLETLYPCDEIVIVDHGSVDGTIRIGREYGASIVKAQTGTTPAKYFQSTHGDWLLCLDPHESLTESLAASLFEWKSETITGPLAFSIFLREETAEGWIEHPAAQTRMVPSGWQTWAGHLPANEPGAYPLGGELLRFTLP
jgi:glycosyltransferase involved in cell wall biosynthesis